MFLLLVADFSAVARTEKKTRGSWTSVLYSKRGKWRLNVTFLDKGHCLVFISSLLSVSGRRASSESKMLLYLQINVAPTT